MQSPVAGGDCLPEVKDDTTHIDISGQSVCREDPDFIGDCTPKIKYDTTQYDFTQQNAFTDAILVVEGKELYTSRYMLASVSPVFCEMFLPCTENDGRIALPDDLFEDIHRMLAWMMPSTRLSVTDSESHGLVHVACKYGIDKLLQECDGHLARHFKGNLKDDNARLDFLLLAQKCKLNNLKECAVQYFSTVKLNELKKLTKFSELQQDVLFDIQENRVILCERSREEAECTDQVNLVVEGKLVPASRTILSAASPAFRSMFSPNFREANSKDIPLPEKLYEDVKFMVDFISQPNAKPLEGSLLNGVLHLSDEYQMGKLKDHCERFMMHTLAGENQTDEMNLHFYILAKKYRIPKVVKATMGPLAKLKVDTLSKLPGFAQEDMYQIFGTRCQLLEKELEKAKRPRVPAFGTSGGH